MSQNLYRRDFLADGRIVCFRFSSSGSEAARLWYEEMTNMIHAWPEDKPLLLLLDLTQVHNQISADAVRTAREFWGTTSDRLGKTAFLVDSQAPTQILDAMLKFVIVNTNERQSFTDEAAAVAWLLEGT